MFRLLSFLIIMIFSVSIYANSLKNGFVYDDYVTISNRFITDFSNLPSLINSDYFRISRENSYRPIVTLTYFIDNSLYGSNPWGYHLTNILLHSLNGILFYILLIFFIPVNRQNRFLSECHFLLYTLLFIGHPVLTETVNAISYREDLLVFLFYIASLNLYLSLRSRVNNKRLGRVLYLLSCMTCFLALLSKEMAITFPVVIYLYEWIYTDNKEGRLRSVLSNYYVLGYISVVIFYVYLRFYYFRNPGEIIYRWPLAERIFTLPWLLLSYLKLSIFPNSLSADYVIAPMSHFFSVPVILYTASLITLIAVAFKMSKKEKGTAFGALFYIITLSPVYNIIPIINPFAERYLYLPLAGLIIAMMIISRIDSVHGKVTLILCLILCTFSLLVIKRNGVWKDGERLWADTARKIPNSSRSFINLGLHRYHSNRINEAIVAFQAALQIKPNEPSYHYYLGAARFKQGSLDEAINELRAALKLKPDESKYYSHIGLIYLEKGRFDEAITEYLTAISINPGDPGIYNELGNVYYKKGMLNEARNAYKTALRLNSGDPELHNNLANVLADLKITPDAIHHYQSALRLNPNYGSAYFNLGLIYAEKGQIDKAIKYYQAALRLDPKHYKAHYNLGLAYLKKGMKEKADTELEISVRLRKAPDMP